MVRYNAWHRNFFFILLTIVMVGISSASALQQSAPPPEPAPTIAAPKDLEDVQPREKSEESVGKNNPEQGAGTVISVSPDAQQQPAPPPPPPDADASSTKDSKEGQAEQKPDGSVGKS